jgi:hypothetical protein
VSRIRAQQETLAHVVDRLEIAVGQLLQLARTVDLTGGAARPYDPVTPEAARAHGANLALALPPEEVRRALAVRYGHERGLLVAALEGARDAGGDSMSGELDVPHPEPELALAESAARLRALRSDLRAS